jgi:hypothetical protein
MSESSAQHVSSRLSFETDFISGGSRSCNAHQLAITMDYSQCPSGRVAVDGGAHWLIKENLLFIDDTCYC